MLLGRGGTWSDRKGLGEERKISWEWLRLDATGGGGGSKAEASGEGVEREDEEEDESRPRRADSADEGRDEGSVFEEEKTRVGTEGGARRDEPLFRDWVLCQDVEEAEERRSDVSASKGSGFHCASLWIPFIPLV